MDRWAAVDNISAEKIILCALLNKIISWMDSGSLALSLVVYVCFLTFKFIILNFETNIWRTNFTMSTESFRRFFNNYEKFEKNKVVKRKSNLSFLILPFQIFIRWYQNDFEQQRFLWPTITEPNWQFWKVRNDFRRKILNTYLNRIDFK